MKWYVLYVKSRTEKKVATRLQNKNIKVFCPIKIEERIWSDRIKKVEVPYFRSYVFAKFKERNSVSILETQGVIRRLFWLGKPAVIREEEMQEVIDFFVKNKSNQISYEDYSKGEEIEIYKGKLKTRKAVVIKNNKDKVTLSMPALGCAFKVILSKTEIRKVT